MESNKLNGSSLSSNSPANLEPSDNASIVWWLSTAQLVSWGTLYYPFAVLAEHVERTLGADKAAINGAWSIALLLTGICGFPIGMLLDRIGGRLVMSLGTLLGSISLFAWSAAGNLFLLYIACIGLGLAMSATLYEAGFAVLTQRFPDSYQKQIARMSLIGGLTPTIFIPLTTMLTQELGWRSTLLILATLNLVICFPIHILTSRRTATRLGGEVDYKLSAKASNKALIRALQHPTFWLLLLAFTCYAVLVSAIIFHIIPVLRERGYGAGTITLAYMVVGPAQVAGRLGLLTLRRHFRMTTAGMLTFAAIPISMGLLLLSPPTGLVAYIALSLYGVGNGVYTIVRGTAVPDLLGRDGYGAINGAHTLVLRVIGAAAPVTVAMAWSVFGSYDPILWILVLIGILAMCSYSAAVVIAERRAREFATSDSAKA